MRAHATLLPLPSHALAPHRPYLRDTRRSAGGVPRSFRVYKDNLTQPGNWSRAATAWPDTIGIGQYFYADVHKMDAAACAYPEYIKPGAAVLPYYIPFRALTVDGAPNMLVAGKLMATSFFANAAMRLHPEEWVTGEAAGVAAALMVSNKWATTLEALGNVAIVQQRELGADRSPIRMHPNRRTLPARHRAARSRLTAKLDTAVVARAPRMLLISELVCTEYPRPRSLSPILRHRPHCWNGFASPTSSSPTKP